MPSFFKTCSHNKVASDPIGVILGPKLVPMMFAYTINCSVISFTESSPIAIELIMTVGKLFIIEDKNAARNPVPIVATKSPFSAKYKITSEMAEVSPAFFKPYTMIYIPIEKKITAQGEFFITSRIFVTLK